MPGAVGSIAGAVAGAFASQAIGIALASEGGPIGEAILGGLLSSTEASLITTGIGALGGAATNFLVQSAFAKKGANPTTQAAQRGALINAASSYAGIPVIYGSRRVGGVRILTEVAGAQNEKLYVAIVWCEGEINTVLQVYLDDTAISDPKFSGLAFKVDHVGTDTQAAAADLIAALPGKWGTTDTVSGIAYTHLLLNWDANAYPRGLPTITADIQGKLVYDPRDATTKFANNPALCLRDYLTNTRYGLKAPSSMIDDTAFSAAANDCDALMTIPTSSGGTTTQAIYSCDGLLDIDQTRLDNIRAILSTCRGYLVYSAGQYKLRVDKLTAPVSFTLNEDNIVGGWSIQLPQKRARANRVRASFIDDLNLFQPNVAVVDSSAYRAADGGTLIEQQLDLALVVDYYRAQGIAQQTLTQTRFGISCQLTATIAAMQLEVGDVVPLTHSTPGWTAKNFRVVGIKLLSTDEVQLTLAEYDDSVYTTPVGSFVSPAPSSNLPNPLNVAAPGTPAVAESLYQTTGSAGVKTKATVSWGASADAFVTNGGRYQVEYKRSADSAWSIAALVQSNVLSVDVFDLVGATSYDFRVKAFNCLNIASAYSATATQYIFGLTAAPSDLANFAVQSYNGQAKFTWAKPSSNSDLDVVIGGRVYVRWSPLTVGATWDHGSLVNPDGYPGDTSIGFGPLLTGTYMAKAADSGGNLSVNAASFVVTEALITGLSTLATVTESPAFAGTKTNVAAVDGGIQLDSVTSIDSMLALMDDWGSIDSLGGVQATGSYAFASKMDLGSVKSARLYTTLGSLAFDVDDLIDSRLNNIDDWGLFDGSVVEDVEAQLMVRTTNDDPAGTPTWGPWHALGLAADYSARGFDFRLDFASGNATHNRSVTSLAVAAKA